MEQQNQQPKQIGSDRKAIQTKKPFLTSKFLLYAFVGAIVGLLIPVSIFFVDFYISHWPLKSSVPATRPQQVIQDKTLRQAQPQDFQDWQTYRNSEFGFEMKYPKDWFNSKYDETANKVSEDKYFVFSSPMKIAEGGVKASDIRLRLRVSNSPSYDELFQKLQGLESEKQPDSGVGFTKLEDLTVGEFPAVRYKLSYVGVSNSATTEVIDEVLMKKEKQTFHFEMRVDFIFPHDIPKIKQLFDQILSTFRFVE